MRKAIALLASSALNLVYDSGNKYEDPFSKVCNSL